MKEFINEKNPSSRVYLRTNFETRREIAESFTFNAEKFEPRTNEEFKFNRIQKIKKIQWTKKNLNSDICKTRNQRGSVKKSQKVWHLT